MIVITGAAGFIGSCLVGKFNEEKHLTDLIVVDDFYKDWKDPNLNFKFIRDWIHRNIFLDWFDNSHDIIDCVIHLGARTDTAEKRKTVFDKLNLNYSKRIWDQCTKYNIPLIYASSAAVYGDGTQGFSDKHNLVKELSALNPYGKSKLDFDAWVLKQKKTPPFWAGLRFFNVYGPNEFHKGRMASVVFHAFNQIKDTGKLRLFKSHKKSFAHGDQSRDFVYVKDVADVIYWLFKNQKKSGIYNLGTGKARSFNDLSKSVFKSMGVKEELEYFDTPKDIRASYQYYTKADIKKLRKAGCKKKFHSLEEGVKDYVKNYLEGKRYF